MDTATWTIKITHRKHSSNSLNFCHVCSAKSQSTVTFPLFTAPDIVYSPCMVMMVDCLPLECTKRFDHPTCTLSFANHRNALLVSTLVRLSVMQNLVQVRRFCCQNHIEYPFFGKPRIHTPHPNF